MSISTTLSNALSGLAAASRSAQIVSTNVSNATTEGYSRREIQLSARTTGGYGAGVQVDGVQRVVDENLIRERRLASSAVGETREVNAFLKDAMSLLGEPQQEHSLVARVAEFDASLLSATTRPESDARLNDVLNAAEAIAEKLNVVSDGIRVARQDADKTIASEVARLNASLEQIADLNAQILRAKATHQDYPALLDNRQNVIDGISELIPIRVLSRDNDTVALYTTNGALLVDVNPAEFGFEQTDFITADMTLASGALSGLTLNGEDIRPDGPYSPISGGRLSGLFQVRDAHAPAFQANVDALAYDLISRFEDPTLDATLGVGDAGLFTDAGSVLDPGNVVGLAGRVSINAAVDPSAGGGVWRLRDGLGAAAIGPVGDASLLDAMRERLNQAVLTTGGSLSTVERSLANHTADLTSFVGQSVDVNSSTLAFQQSRYAGLDEAVMANGVDTDQELQKLLLIEQAYAANARVIQTADELIQLLIGL